jgi:glycine/D-amino acid oxidase-like deaminating enzyme
VASLAELRSSAVLRTWSGYVETGAVYLRDEGDGGLPDELGAIEAGLPGSVSLADGRELRCLGWTGLPAGTVGILERRAGYVNAAALRSALLADLAPRANVRVVAAAAGRVIVHADGTITASPSPSRRIYDVAILAAGAWTPGILRASGLPAAGLRTKAIECATYAVRGRRPVPFADETSGLYGKPTADGRLMLGVASDEWDVAPGVRLSARTLHARVTRIARARMPWLELGPALVTVNATDCYCDPPVLALRPVAGEHGSIWTFTGGSGGSLKTALAASREAAEHLLGDRRRQPMTQRGRS